MCYKVWGIFSYNLVYIVQFWGKSQKPDVNLQKQKSQNCEIKSRNDRISSLLGCRNGLLLVINFEASANDDANMMFIILCVFVTVLNVQELFIITSPSLFIARKDSAHLKVAIKAAAATKAGGARTHVKHVAWNNNCAANTSPLMVWRINAPSRCVSTEARLSLSSQHLNRLYASIT